MKNIVVSIFLLGLLVQPAFSEDFLINLKLRAGMRYSLERDSGGTWNEYTYPYENFSNVTIFMKEKNCGLGEYIPCWTGLEQKKIFYSDGFEVLHSLSISKLRTDGDFRVTMTSGGFIKGKFIDTNSTTFYVRDIENMDMLINISLTMGLIPIQRGFYFDVTDR